MTTSEFSTILNESESIDVIDVRTPAEYRSVHVCAARSVPLDELEPAAVRQGCPSGASGPTYILCKSGKRAQEAAKRLGTAGEGFDPVVVEGGTDACVTAGFDVVRGKQAMSLERQVRVTAGTLVAVGTVLGAVVNPWFLVVPGFVGCGLVFAGITDTCGMGVLLARMPWNR